MREIVLATAFVASACSNDSTTPEAADASRTQGGKEAGDAGGSDAGNEIRGFNLDWGLADGRGALGGDAGTSPDGGMRALPGLPGARICVLDRADIACATSDADGSFRLVGLPARTALTLTFDKEGYLKESKTILTSSTDMNVPGNKIVMFVMGEAELPGGVTQDTDKGSVDFFAVGPSPDDPNLPAIIAGVTVSISPAGESRPYFYDATGRARPEATTTLGGFGFFFNLPPGDYELTFTHEKYDCAPLSAPIAGWGIPKLPHSVKFTAAAGYLTEEVAVLCTEMSVIVEGDGGQ